MIREKTIKVSDYKIAYEQFDNNSKLDYGILFLHGLKSDRNGSKAQFIKQFCELNHITFTCFDFFGHGESSGDFFDGNISIWQEDALEIITQICDKPQIIIGSSMGGWIMFLLALSIPSKIKGLIGIAPAVDFTENIVVAKNDNIANQKLMICDANGQDKFYISKQLLQDGKKNLLFNKQNKFAAPTILLHGMQDKDVLYNVSLKIAEEFVFEKNIEVMISKNSGHSFSDMESINILKNAIEKMMVL